MAHSITVVDQQDRIVRIASEAKASTSTETMPFRNKLEPMKVIRIPIELLLYRMENGRTRMKQEEFIRRNNKPEDYFLTGEENEEVQAAQHSILAELARDSRGNILEELAYRRAQTEKLLITHTGVVVNGNRRLAAMRELLSPETGKTNTEFASFANVDVVVLPSNATTPDIEEIEADLQEIPETKLEYDWISRRLKLRHRRDVLKIVPETLRRWYRFRSLKDINKEIEQLELAEDYLERYLKKPKEYEAVEKSEQIFKQLQSALEPKSGEIEELSRFIAYPLIKEARELEDRVYQFRSAFGEDAAEVVCRIASEEDIQLSAEATVVDTEEDEDDPLAGISEEGGKKYEAVKTALSDVSNSKQRAQQIAKIATAIQQEKREGGRKVLALKKAQEANTILHEIDLNGADANTFPALLSQLESCIARANELSKSVKEHSKTAATSA